MLEGGVLALQDAQEYGRYEHLHFRLKVVLLMGNQFITEERAKGRHKETGAGAQR